MAGVVTPIPDALDLLLDASTALHEAWHQAHELDEPLRSENIVALEFLERLLDGLVHDVDRGELMVGQCHACEKVHVWRPDADDLDEVTS